MSLYLTDTERQYRPKRFRGIYRFWLVFELNLSTRSPSFRRWFPTIEARNQYILDLPKHATVTDHGEEPESC